MTGEEIWDKTIKYHDPDGKWATFSGKVQLATSMDNGYHGSEEIEIDNTNGTYMSTRIVDGVKVTKGTREENCFLAVEGKDTDAQSDKEKYDFDCDGAIFTKQHHSSHIGMPMALKAAGAEVDSDVSMVTLSGKEYYAIRFTGNANDVVHPHWESARTLYIDPETFAMYGVKFESEFDGAYTYTEGEFNVNGIRMAQAKIFFRSDGSFWGTDVFSQVE